MMREWLDANHNAACTMAAPTHRHDWVNVQPAFGDMMKALKSINVNKACEDQFDLLLAELEKRTPDRDKISTAIKTLSECLSLDADRFTQNEAELRRSFGSMGWAATQAADDKVRCAANGLFERSRKFSDIVYNDRQQGRG